MIFQKKTMLVLLALLAIFSGCKNASDSDDEVEIDYSNHSPCSIKVRNQSNQNLVAFKGRISASSMIGGVKAGSEVGLAKDASLFGSNSEDFPLYLLTEEQYLANKGDLNAVKNEPYGVIYAFYNSDSSANNTVFTVGSRLAGKAILELDNGTTYNCEIRQNGVDGETLGYVAAYHTSVQLHLEPGDYNFFPVFKKFSKTDGEIYEAFPKFSDGSPLFKSLGLNLATTEHFDVTDVFHDMDASKLTTGASYLRITNSANTGCALRLGSSNVDFLNSTGIQTINPGKTVQYKLKFEKKPDNTYPENATFSLKLAAGYRAKAFPEETTAANYFECDRIYDVVITGGNDVAEFDIAVTKGELLDVKETFGFN